MLYINLKKLLKKVFLTPFQFFEILALHPSFPMRGQPSS